MKKILAEGKEIYELIPQRPPMVMIHKLVFSDNDGAKTNLFVDEKNLFYQNGKLREPALIENIAQTAAAWTGYKTKMENKPIREGFIGAIKNLVIYALPELNSTIETEVKVEYQVMNATVISGKIRSDEKLLAECEMKIFLKDLT